MSTQNAIYSPSFFSELCDGSARSAEIILPIVFDLIKPSSVVDIGCGVGTWLASAEKLGISNYLGVDGDYVPIEMLRINRSHFRRADLSTGLLELGKFDLALCLEVAEHLPEEAAPELVRNLTQLAPAVLFSAAIPGQMGNGHINERWQDYWVDLFATNRFVPIDCVRPVVWHRREVDYWYAQNALLMADADYVRCRPELVQAQKKTVGPFSIVHPRTLEFAQDRARQIAARGISGWLREGPAVASRTLRHRLGSGVRKRSKQ